MEFDQLLEKAQAGSKSAREELFLMYHPLVISRSMIEGYFSEDLYQELSIIFLHCIDQFQIDEMEKRLK